MLGYMNREAYEKSLSEGRVTFYSRTRRRLWTKGETSGNYLDIVSVTADCDNDTLLIRAIPHGPTCHTGAASCFDGAAAGPEGFHPLSAGRHPKATRRDARGLLHEQTLRARVNKIAQKVGEEAVETVIEACNGTDERLIYEGADLIYHMIVLLTSKGYRIEDLARELKERHSATWKKH